jgi:peptidoglycan hydrolase-like protein with peptidoglycan-binding domain
MPLIILGSVGRGGRNNTTDVRVVQRLLNDYIGDATRLLKVDGIVGPKTIGAINAFQTEVTKIVDGRIDPGGPAIKKLAELHLKNAMGGINRQASSLVSLSVPQTLPLTHALLDEYWRLLRNA